MHSCIAHPQQPLKDQFGPHGTRSRLGVFSKACLGSRKGEIMKKTRKCNLSKIWPMPNMCQRWGMHLVGFQASLAQAHKSKICGSHAKEVFCKLCQSPTQTMKISTLLRIMTTKKLHLLRRLKGLPDCPHSYARALHVSPDSYSGPEWTLQTLM